MLRKLFLLAMPLAGLLVAGCSSTPRLKPINAANEPVFHDRNYLSLGIGGGPLWVNNDGGLFGSPNAVSRSAYVVPAVAWAVNVTPWAEYMVPLFGNFLFTGSQYQEDGVHLKTGKLHLAAMGGLSTLAYSGREGWFITSMAGLRGKYLPNDRLFFETVALSEVVGAFEAATDRGQIGAGIQLTDHIALAADYFTLRFRTSDATLGGESHEIDLYHGDYLSGLTLSLPSYLGRKHVLTPEVGYEVRNLEFADTWSLRTGLHYRFVFD